MSMSLLFVSLVGAYVATGFALFKYSLGSQKPRLVRVKVRTR